MSITTQDIRHIARLAMLEFSDAEVEALKSELNTILQYMEKLSELNTENVEPLSHPLPIKTPLREDRVEASLPQEVALKNAPHKENGYFKVPKVIK